MTIIQSAGGTFSSTTFTATLPSLGATSKMVVLVEGDTVVNTPSGWTLRTSVVNNAGQYWFERTAAGGAATQAFTNSTGAGVWVAYEIAGTYNSATGSESSAAGTTYTSPSHTPPAGATDILVGAIAEANTTATLTSFSGGFTKDFSGQVLILDSPVGGTGSQAATATGAAFSSTATFSTAASTSKGMLIGSYASTGSGGTAGSVTAVPATASAVAAVPLLVASTTQAPPTAVATAAAPVPAVSGQQLLTGSVTGVPATASAAGVAPVITSGQAPTLFPPSGVVTASAPPPVVGGGLQALQPPAASALGGAVSPSVAGLVVLAGSVSSVPATALTGASVPVVVGSGATPGSVTALPIGVLAGAVPPGVGTRGGAYLVGYGGALVFVHDDSRITLTVDVFSPAGRPVVYSDSARTVQVPLPLTFNQPGIYSLFFTENYAGYVSVLKDGEEVASKPDARGVLSFAVRNEEWLVFAPGRDPM